MATRAEQLAEAELEYHKLMTGKAARVFVDQNGERVEFVAANADRLRAYIDSLRKPLPTLGVSTHNRPIGFLF